MKTGTTIVFQAGGEGGLDRAAATEVKSRVRVCSEGHVAGFADGLCADLRSQRGNC